MIASSVLRGIRVGCVRRVCDRSLYGLQGARPLPVWIRSYSNAAPAVDMSLLKKLRRDSGAPLADCKSALVESENDFEKATALLQQKGHTTTARSGRTSAQGTLSVFAQGNAGILVELNSETDFVGQSDKFKNLATEIGKRSLGLVQNQKMEEGVEVPLVVDEILSCRGSSPNEPAVKEDIADLTYHSGENILLQRVSTLRGAHVYGYSHQGRIAALISFQAENEKMAQKIGPKLAMHVVGYMPAVIEATEGVESTDTMLLQDFELYDDEAGTVGEVLKRENITIDTFVRWKLGEKVESAEEEDFASEVKRKLAAVQ